MVFGKGVRYFVRSVRLQNWLVFFDSKFLFCCSVHFLLCFFKSRFKFKYEVKCSIKFSKPTHHPPLRRRSMETCIAVVWLSHSRFKFKLCLLNKFFYVIVVLSVLCFIFRSVIFPNAVDEKMVFGTNVVSRKGVRYFVRPVWLQNGLVFFDSKF